MTVPVGEAAREAILTATPSIVIAPGVNVDEYCSDVVTAVLALSELLKLVASTVAHVVLVSQALFAQAARVATDYPFLNRASVELLVGSVRVKVPEVTEIVPPKDPI